MWRKLNVLVQDERLCGRPPPLAPINMVLHWVGTAHWVLTIRPLVRHMGAVVNTGATQQDGKIGSQAWVGFFLPQTQTCRVELRLIGDSKLTLCVNGCLSFIGDPVIRMCSASHPMSAGIGSTHPTTLNGNWMGGFWATKFWYLFCPL